MNIKLKKFFGISLLVIISLIPVALWFIFGNGLNEFSKSGTHSLGEIFGLVGMTLFALTFVLSTRIKIIEDMFGGLDKVYIIHGITGGIALILILAHPIFLVLRLIPNNLGLAATYLLPGTHWAINFGIIALTGLIILLFITLYTKIKYHKWKIGHEFLGLAFILAVLHIFLVRWTISKDAIFEGYLLYAIAVSSIGILAFSYSLFLKNRIIKNAIYRIESITPLRDTFKIILTPENKPISYKSGQFIFLRFYNTNLSKEAHPFSIASKSDNSKIKIIVKKLGDFTENLGKIKPGDKVSIEGPYGRFGFYSSPEKDQVWIAAGIGITPFLGMAEDLDKGLKKKIELYHTAREKEFIGYEFFSNLDLRNFRFIPWDSNKKGRITIEEIEKMSGNLRNKEFFICGPEGFKESLIQNLLKKGIKKENIHEEAFEFR